jgi:spermidine synthase
VRQRLASSTFPEPLADFGFDDEFAVLGSFVAGPQALARFAGGAPVNTDDRTVVAYRAPRITYAPDSLPRDRLIALLAEWSVAPGDVVGVSADDPWSARLAAYFSARNRFIEVGREVRPTGDVRAMLAQVEAPLLGILHTSPDFRPAYDPLWRMGMALAASDLPAARALLTELMRLQPARPEAAAGLQRLSTASAAER